MGIGSKGLLDRPLAGNARAAVVDGLTALATSKVAGGRDGAWRMEDSTGNTLGWNVGGIACGIEPVGRRVAACSCDAMMLMPRRMPFGQRQIQEDCQQFCLYSPGPWSDACSSIDSDRLIRFNASSFIWTSPMRSKITSTPAATNVVYMIK